jgi:acyl-CoA dehydrogenase
VDFTFSETQDAVREAATGIFNGLVDPDRVTAIEQTDDRIDRDLWSALAEAGLLALGLPAAVGGENLGLMEIGLLLEAQGQCVAPIPLWSTLVLGALPIAKFGTSAQHETYLRSIGEGTAFASAALADVAISSTRRSSVTATPSGDGYVLTGVATAVPNAHVASFVLVPATTADGSTIVAIVDPTADGVRQERATTTNREVHPHLHFSSVAVEGVQILAGEATGAAVLEAMLDAAITGLCIIATGCGEAAIAQTAAYLNTREQFGRTLSTFQGTMLRLADAAIDEEVIRVTAWNAAWLIDQGADAAEAVRVAKWHTSDRGQRVVHATQHLHGGMGADISYPIHRYFLWNKQIELQLGSPSLQIAALGELLAARPVGVGGR